MDETPDLADGVTAMVSAPNGQTLFVGTQKGAVVRWDMVRRKESLRWTAHAGPIYALAMTENGRLLATGAADNVVRLWDTPSSREVSILRGHEQTIRCVAFSGDGRWLASGSQDGTIRVWDTTHDPRGRVIPFHHRLNDIALVETPQGLLVRAAALIGQVDSISMQTGTAQRSVRVGVGHRRAYPVRYVTFVGPKKNVAHIAEAQPNVLRLTDSESGAVLREWPAFSGPIATMATDYRHQWLAWATTSPDGSQIHWWNSATDEAGGPIRVDAPNVRALAISSDGRWIAAHVNPTGGSTEFTTRVFDATGQSPPQVLTRGPIDYGALAFRPDNRELATVANGIVHAFAVGSWKKNFEFPCDQTTTCLAYSPDNIRLAVVGYAGNVTLVDPTNGKRVFQLQSMAPGRPDDMACDARVMFSPDGRWLVSTNWDGSINVWDSWPSDALPDSPRESAP
jgi:WD40 repeat protein